MHAILEPVALTRDIPVAGLRCGDIGAVGFRHRCVTGAITARRGTDQARCTTFSISRRLGSVFRS
jgi:hypothetical protein